MNKRIGKSRPNGIENGEVNSTLQLMTFGRKLWWLVLPACCFGTFDVVGQESALKAPSELLSVQEPPKTVPRVLDNATPEKTRVVVSLSRQRAYLLVGDEVAMDVPVSTGKRRAQTPTGEFKVEEKSAHFAAPWFGDFVDSEGRVARSNVSTRVDAAPSGTKFRPAELRYHLRLNAEGLSLHAGSLPGYPATDTSVRLAPDIAPLIFQRVQVGTPVKIED
jgi:lipoprotein-anchoring transpeptidase ErfK/SrfK